MRSFSIIGVALTALSVVLSQSTENCKTPSNHDGICIEITQCPVLYATISKHDITHDELTLLTSSRCGKRLGLPLVCCPAVSQAEIGLQFYSGRRKIEGDPCETSHIQDGICRSILAEECAMLRHITTKSLLYENDWIYLSTSKCDSGNTNVFCCPQRSNGVINPEKSVARSNLPMPPSCGDNGPTDRIFRYANETQIGEYPWTALLSYTKPLFVGVTEEEFHCGGVLISERYVLTAAHCLKSIPRDWTLSSVRLGDWDTATAIDCMYDFDCIDSNLDITIEEQISHELYNPFDASQKYDIALLRLSETVKNSDFIQPICLPTTANNEYTNYADRGPPIWVVSGWGANINGIIRSSKKQQQTASIYDSISCRNFYQGKSITIDETQICGASEERANSNLCKGDSGGSLMFVPGTGYYYFAYGISSFGFETCGVPYSHPGIFTNIKSYIDWIEAKIKI